MKRRFTSFAGVFFALALTILPAMADSLFWNDATSDWFTPGNWTPPGPPTANDFAFINNFGTAQIAAPGAVALGLTLGDTTFDAGAVEVDGAGRLAVTDLLIGKGGFANFFATNGGRAGAANISIGTFTTGLGLAFVDGAGSQLNGTIVTVGSGGEGTLNLTNGATSLFGQLNIGVIDGRGTVNVGGAGSKVTINSMIGSLNLAGPGATGLLNITNGGVVELLNANASVRIGENGVGEVIVDGAGSMLTTTGNLFAGEFGNGFLQVKNGGVVSNNNGIIAFDDGSNGAATVDGAGSTWTNAGTLRVGEQGLGSLRILNGGTVTNTNGLVGGNDNDLAATAGRGGITVDGAGSNWTNSGHLEIGITGQGIMFITNGGVVSNTFALLGRFDTATGEVTVDGTGSTWTNSSFLTVGQLGDGTLNITNGGVVTSVGAGELGSGGGAGTVTVDGSGSIWTNTGAMFVGENGDGTLNITNGGQVSNTFANVAVSQGVTGQVTVDGTGSMWTNNGDLTLANFGQATLIVSNGGVVMSAKGFIAGHPGDVGPSEVSEGFASVTGLGSQWTLSDTLSIGELGNGQLDISNGGKVLSLNGLIGASGATGVGTVNVGGGGSLWVNSGDLTIGDPGTGLLAIQSGGEVDATTTRIRNGGIAIVNGGLASGGGIFVLPGGILGGTGATWGSVDNSGIVRPGNLAGTFTIMGNYTQNADGTLRTEIGGLNSGVESDLLTVSLGGAASLNGTLQLLRLNNFLPLPGDQITILQAENGVTGEFATVTDDFGTIVHPTVVYNPNDVMILFVQGSFNIGGLTPNQLSVAEALDHAFAAGCASDIILFLDQEPLAALPHDFDLIAPEELTAIYELGFSHAIVQGLNLQRRMDDIRAGSNGFSANGYAMRDSRGGLNKGPDGKMDLEPESALLPSCNNRWGVFVTGAGQFINVDGDFNAGGYDITTGGVTVGVDYRLTSNSAIGLFTTYAHSNVDLVNDGNIDANTGKVGLFGTFYTGEFYFQAAVSGGWSGYDTRRTSLLGNAHGDTSGAEFNGLVAAGYDWTFGCLTIGPTASFQYNYINLDSFTESGSLAPLHFPEQDQNAERSTVGLRAVCHWKTNGVAVRPEARVAWKHEYGDRAYDFRSRFIDCDDRFTVLGPHLGRDSALVNAGVTVQWTNCISTYVSYDGDLGRDRYTSHGVSGGVSFGF